MQISVLMELHEKCMISQFSIYENCMRSFFGQPGQCSFSKKTLNMLAFLAKRNGYCNKYNQLLGTYDSIVN